jgi:hypothetical protein
MIDINKEQPVSLKDAMEFVPGRNGKKATLNTLYRWTRSGCFGVRLEYIFIGGVRYTSREALLRFFGEITRVKEAQRYHEDSRPS